MRWHGTPTSRGWIVGYRIGEDQSGRNGTILQPVSRWRGRPMSESGSDSVIRRCLIRSFSDSGRTSPEVRFGARSDRWAAHFDHLAVAPGRRIPIASAGCARASVHRQAHPRRWLMSGPRRLIRIRLSPRRCSAGPLGSHTRRALGGCVETYSSTIFFRVGYGPCAA